MHPFFMNLSLRPPALFLFLPPLLYIGGGVKCKKRYKNILQNLQLLEKQQSAACLVTNFFFILYFVINTINCYYPLFCY